MSDFYRAEALEHRQQSWLGGIQLVRPLSSAVLTTLVLVVLAAVGAYLVLGEYTRKARVAGYLVPDRGVIRLLARDAGTLVERRASEGGSVRAGDVLFVLSIDRASAAGDTEAAVKASLALRERSLRDATERQDQLLRAQRAALEQRAAHLKRELAQMRAEAALHEERIALALQHQRRLEGLRAENFISEAQVRAKSEALIGVRAQARALERQRVGHEREIAAVEAELRELPLRAEARQGEIEREFALLKQEAAQSDARARLVVRAPQDGVVTAVTVDAGQAVAEGAVLASLLPADAQLEAHLYAPSSAVGFVRPGQPVLLRYQAYPYQKFGHHAGRVVLVSRAPLVPGESSGLSAAFSRSEPLYRITVALDRQVVHAYGKEQPLAAGMQLDADVLLDRRRLVEWLLEPVLSVAGRV